MSSQVKLFTLSFIIILIVLGGIYYMQQSKKISKINFDSPPKSETSGIAKTKTNREIQITKGVKHSVPLDKIIGGGPPKDGIPSIDNPKFISPEEASKTLNDEEVGLTVSINSKNRFYPFQILVWHEIVNDTIEGKRILVTYCPLCFTGVVYDPLVDGERVEFGTSGKLYESNLVMYDRKTDSYWSQVLGEAILGPQTGNTLKLLPSDIMKFGNFKQNFPDGVVLSRDTGATRFYGQDPYGDYYTTSGVFFPVSNRDDRLGEKDFVLGILEGDKSKAYSVDAVKREGRVEDSFAGKTIIAEHDKDKDIVLLYEQKADGTLERINPLAGFWFSWVSVHPNTEIYK